MIFTWPECMSEFIVAVLSMCHSMSVQQKMNQIFGPVQKIAKRTTSANRKLYPCQLSVNKSAQELDKLSYEC